MSKSKQSKETEFLSDDDDLEVYNNSDIESDIENEESDLPKFKKDKINIEVDNDDNENDYIEDENEDIDDETYEPDDENGDDEENESYNHTYIEDNINLNENENNDMKYEVIVKSENRITSNILSIYEFIELISVRSSQITNGSYVFTDINGLSDPIEMAKKELLDNKCPLYVKRYIGLNKYELWSPNVMSKPKL